MVLKNEHNHNASQELLLTEAPLSIPLTVTGINAGSQAQSRLASMGILPGEKLIILQRDNGGPLVLEVKGTRVALGRGISQKVIVLNGHGHATE